MAGATSAQRETEDAVVNEDVSVSPQCSQESEIMLKTEEGRAVGPSTSSAACAACLRVFTLTKTGSVRTHAQLTAAAQAPEPLLPPSVSHRTPRHLRSSQTRLLQTGAKWKSLGA